MKKLLKRQLILKSKFDADIPEEVEKFKKSQRILENEGYDFEQGTETVATEFLKRLYFRYSLATDFIIWVVIPIFTLFLIL